MSLRDVKRAMIVFEYLYGMMDVFGPLMDKWASGKRRHVGNEDDDKVRCHFSCRGQVYASKFSIATYLSSYTLLLCTE